MRVLETKERGGTAAEGARAPQREGPVYADHPEHAPSQPTSEAKEGWAWLVSSWDRAQVPGGDCLPHW